MAIVYILMAFVMGCIVTYLLTSKRVQVLESSLELQQKHAEELRQIDAKNYEARIAEMKADTLNANVEQRKQWSMEFQNLATQILNNNSSQFQSLSTNSIKAVLDPLKDRISEFRTKVEQCYGDEAKERFSLRQEIDKLVRENQKISEDANNLTNALKGDSKTQGDWGEMILDSILENSGLIKDEQYFTQSILYDEDGKILKSDEGHGMKPDVIVKYPGNRSIIIDSKVSLTAYNEYVASDDTSVKALKLKSHIDSLKRHIDELSTKDYSKFVKDAPDFVMMFIPVEHAYYMAMKTDPNLWDYAYKKKVVLMNATNLITALRLSLDLWRRDSQEKNILEIVRVGSDLYDKFVLFTENMKKVGDALDKAQDSYSDAMKQLKTGSGNLVSRAEKLKELGITPKKKLSINSEETLS